MSTPNYESPQYIAHKNQVSLVNNFYCGVDTAKQYLSQFPREETTKFQERQSRATLDNNVLKTTETVANIIFRKDLDLKGITNATVKTWTDKIDFKQDLNSFSKEVLKNRIRDGITFVLVDSPSFDEEIVTSQLVAQEQNIRPYFVNILRKNVINWKMNKFNEYERFTIKEFYTHTVDKYTEEEREQIKVWFDDGTVEVWRDDELFQSFNTGINRVPFVQIGNDLIPPLYDQAKINNVHFDMNSQYDNYVEVGAAPFLAVYAFQEQQGAAKTLGINDGLSFSDKTQGGVEWIEMSGDNAKIIADRIAQHELSMLSIAITFATSSNVKTATQVETEKTEDESKLVNYAVELEDGINKALEMLQLYETVSLGKNIIVVNKDFNANVITPEQANSYLSLYTQNVISLERLWDLLEKGEYLPIMEEKDRTTEKVLINDNAEVE